MLFQKFSILSADSEILYHGSLLSARITEELLKRTELVKELFLTSEKVHEGDVCISLGPARRRAYLPHNPPLIGLMEEGINPE